MSQTAETNAAQMAKGQLLEVHTLHDAEFDERRERFFEGIERLIFLKAYSEAHKSAILRRYARMLENQGDRWSSDAALQLAETYDTTMRQFH